MVVFNLGLKLRRDVLDVVTSNIEAARFAVHAFEELDLACFSPKAPAAEVDAYHSHYDIPRMWPRRLAFDRCNLRLGTNSPRIAFRLEVFRGCQGSSQAAT